jgi:hypothetical protein
MGQQRALETALQQAFLYNQRILNLATTIPSFANGGTVISPRSALITRHFFSRIMRPAIKIWTSSRSSMMASECVRSSLYLSRANADQLVVSGQTHYVNNTMYYCHTSCNLLNAGTAESYFANVTSWVQSHPYDVVTLLVENGDLVNIDKYVDPIQKSGLGAYAYEPPKVPMAWDDWPTLSQLILSQKRVIIIMDYNANQTAVPYVLDEFSQVWETPFSPTNHAFPCNIDRPPNLSPQDAPNRLYIANHNLNTQVSLAGTSLLVPNTVEINQTNGIDGYGSLGLMANSCTSMSNTASTFPQILTIDTADWNRAPNVLLVDFYNQPNNGSVFEVAATFNGVTYTRKCCGLVPSSASRPGLRSISFVTGLMIFSLFSSL